MILKNYRFLWIVILILVLTVALLAYSLYKSNTPITDFDSCVAAGNPILEIYPEQCRTSDGRLFTRDVNITPTPSTGTDSNNTACTLEAKLCPDGSYVGRTGPNCEFAPCPN